MKTILVTGGAGFIGSALVRQLVAQKNCRVVNVDKLTYAGNPKSVAVAAGGPHYAFEQVDICDGPALARLFAQYQPQAVMHLAAESHVDRSIDGPAAFIQTNLMGTYQLLEAARGYWEKLAPGAKAAFRFLHVSTDEVYGALGPKGAFDEDSPHRPNSPYSASKAGSDHLARAWHHTYGLPVITTNCCNNYGPWQYPEKLIPVILQNALAGRPLPVYGQGENVREWIYVEDHAEGLRLALEKGVPGQAYNLGSGHELANLELVKRLCAILDRLVAGSPHIPHQKQITFVADRPGHDFRYAINSAKAKAELGFAAATGLDEGLEKTVRWYLENGNVLPDAAKERRGLR